MKFQSKTENFQPFNEFIFRTYLSERLYLETKWASLLAYGKTVELLKDVLPISSTLNSASVRNHLVKVADKEEAQLGDERMMFIEGCERDWGELPRPEGTIVVGLDGGYLRSWENKQKHFEVIAGKSLPRDQKDKYFAFVDTYKQAKPKRRLFETLRTQGFQANQEIEFLSDGATNLHDLQEYLSPRSEHYLDWFHITMRITVLRQYLKGMAKEDKENATTFESYLDKVKGYLWHGNIRKALFYLDWLDEDIYFVENAYKLGVVYT